MSQFYLSSKFCRGFHSMLDVCVKVNIEPTQFLEDSKDNPAQEIFVDHVSEVEVPPLVRYLFQKHKVSTQDEDVPKIK